MYPAGGYLSTVPDVFPPLRLQDSLAEQGFRDPGQVPETPDAAARHVRDKGFQNYQDPAFQSLASPKTLRPVQLAGQKNGKN